MYWIMNRKIIDYLWYQQDKTQKICDSYLANRGARDVVAFLAPHGITPNRAVQLYREYGNETMEIVKIIHTVFVKLPELDFALLIR